MAYSSASLLKVRRMLNQKIDLYAHMTYESIRVSISNGNKKIGRVLNFSTAPIITCGHACHVCAGFCYDIKACLQYPNTVIDARARNTALALHARDYLFNQIDVKMSRRRTNKFFRWHVAGDIIDIDYFSRMVENARKHSDFTIWTYTKQYAIVNACCDAHGRDAIPANFHIMFSKWDGLPMDNPYNFPVFACKLKAGNMDTPDEWFFRHFQCPGNCDVCKERRTGCIAGVDTWCNEH